MAYSSILGGDPAPTRHKGSDSDALGPSDNSDSGSDAIGTREIHADSDGPGTGECGAIAGDDAVEGADIAPDRVVHLTAGAEDDLGGAVPSGPEAGSGFPEADPDSQEFTDLDSDAGGDGGEADDSDGER